MIEEDFHTYGYAVRKAVFDQVELDRLRGAADQMVDLANRNPNDLFCNYYLGHRPDQGALYDLYQRDPTFRRAAENEQLLSFLRDVAGPEFYLFENSLVYKPQGADNAVPWHQDFMYMTGDPEKLIVWIALVDVDEENGCLYVIPGSHKNGVVPWSTKYGETHHRRTDMSAVNVNAAEPVMLQAGDVLVFHHLLLHSSKRVDTPRKRRAFRMAIKRLENSYTPRATPIVLSRALDETALLKPYISHRRTGFVGRVGRALEKLGKKIGYTA